MASSRQQWSELKPPSGEEEPLTGSRKSGCVAKKLEAGKCDEESDIWDTGFTLREFSQHGIRIWLAFQVVALFFQAQLWSEVSSHLDEYDDTIHTECAPEHREHGICTGPMWKLSSYQDVVLKSSSWRNDRRQWQFSTLSDPPTFLIAVDPVELTKDGSEPQAMDAGVEDDGPDLKDARWTLEVTRVNPPHVGAPFQRIHSGQQAVTIEDFSIEAKDTLAKQHRLDWQATLISRGHSSWKTRFLAFVEDAAMPHLDVVHRSQQCAFGKSWKAFTEHHQGSNHRALTRCKQFLGIFLLLGAGAVFLVHKEATEKRHSYWFHWLVLAKFFVQDIPQQICIVLYIYGWYEASGLRCQLCLFRPEHCGDEAPFHFSNMVAFGCTLLSSTANQLLIRPAFKREYNEDDICLQYSVRTGGVCVSILPFTTAMCFASRTILPVPFILHVLLAIPCGLGWFALAGSLCLPVVVCCDEDSY